MWNPGTTQTNLLCVRCQRLKEQRRPHGTAGDSRYSAQSIMYGTFGLVMWAGVRDPVGEYSVRMLEEAIAVEKAKGGFDTFYYEPCVTYNPWRSRL